MPKAYSLQALTPLTDSYPESPVDSFELAATRVRHTKRLQGGLWDMAFTIPLQLPGGQRLSRSYLQDWFDSRLFHVIKQTSGGATLWRGFVWSMDLTLDGMTRRKDYSEIYNAVKTVYIDESGNNQLTAYYTDDLSISLYGRRELLLYMRNANSAAAIAEAQTALLELKTPWARPIAMDTDNTDQLDVVCVGVVFTANNKFVGATTLDGTSTNIESVISDIATNDCEFLAPGRMDTNTIQYKRTLDQPVRAWDLVRELTVIGDGSNLYRSWVSDGDFLHYGAADNEPQYLWQGKGKGLATKSGYFSIADAWAVEPSVVRDMTRPSGPAIPGSSLQDSRDSWIFEAEMADELTAPILKPEFSEEDEVKNAMSMYRRWLEVEGDRPIVRSEFGG